MSAGTSPLFPLIICFLVCSSDAQTNIRAENIPAHPGQDVILPCKVPSNNNNITAVEWIRPEMDPEYVLFYRDGHLDPDNQHPSYQNRVDLQDKDMKDGDFSLILKNVTKEDTGTYECRVFEKGKNDPISITYLKISLSAQKMIGVEKITADVGQNVTLPCEVPSNNKTITAVEWSRPDLKPDRVLLYQDGRIDPDNQHPSYQDRVDLQDKEMKDGNFSLILKDVKMEDTGTYECWVLQRKNKELISITILEVLPSDHSWKIKVGVGVPLGVIILLTTAAGLFYWKRKKEKKEMQKELQQLMGNNSETINQLQQKKQENEAPENELEELDEMNFDSNSDSTGSDEENQQEELEPLAAEDV